MDAQVRFGTGNKTKNILEDNLSSLIILKPHVLTVSCVTSKIATQYSAIKNNQGRFLNKCGVGDPSDNSLKSAEHYLVNIIQQNFNYKMLDAL